jgi:hypothetical protein
MYPKDNIFDIYFRIGRRTPFLVKRCALESTTSKERCFDPKQDRTFLVEVVKPRRKYGKAYGKCFMNGLPDNTYQREYYQLEDDEIPCAGCGEWVLIDVPGISLEELFPIHKENDIIDFGKYKGKTIGDIYRSDCNYLHWLEGQDRLFRIDFEVLKKSYPGIE